MKNAKTKGKRIGSALASKIGVRQVADRVGAMAMRALAGADLAAGSLVVHALGHRPGSRLCGQRVTDELVRRDGIRELTDDRRAVEWQAAIDDLLGVVSGAGEAMAGLGLASLEVKACGVCVSNMEAGRDAARKASGKRRERSGGDDGGFGDEEG